MLESYHINIFGIFFYFFNKQILECIVSGLTYNLYHFQCLFSSVKRIVWKDFLGIKSNETSPSIILYLRVSYSLSLLRTRISWFNILCNSDLSQKHDYTLFIKNVLAVSRLEYISNILLCTAPRLSDGIKLEN